MYILCHRVQQKREFIQQRQNVNQHGSDNADDNTVSADELSQFYKQFLDDNYQLHRNYNRYAAVDDSANDNNTLEHRCVAGVTTMMLIIVMIYYRC